MNKITEAMIEAAWQAFGDCPIDMCGDHDEEQKKCVVAAVEAALSAGQAQPVAIKPLEWERNEAGTWYAASPMGTYLVNQGRWWRKGRTPLIDVGHDAAAKAAAQKDYETRILSALVPPAVPGEVEKHAPVEHLGGVRDAIEAVWKNSLIIESSVRRGDGPSQYEEVVKALDLIKQARTDLAEIDLEAEALRDALKATLATSEVKL